ncbi:hypothetical protein SBA2_640006 [Acidobacteriia bacterium SbA2]|nr:hypothetical protein SBA2_640006 [Acidobacteriia bacterium SbA2]
MQVLGLAFLLLLQVLLARPMVGESRGEACAADLFSFLATFQPLDNIQRCDPPLGGERICTSGRRLSCNSLRDMDLRRMASVESPLKCPRPRTFRVGIVQRF